MFKSNTGGWGRGRGVFDILAIMKLMSIEYILNISSSFHA